MPWRQQILESHNGLWHILGRMDQKLSHLTDEVSEIKDDVKRHERHIVTLKTKSPRLSETLKRAASVKEWLAVAFLIVALMKGIISPAETKELLLRWLGA